MKLLRAIQILYFVAMTAFMIRLGVIGWRRRRPYWTSSSWWRFTATCSICLAIAFAPAIPVIDRLRVGAPGSQLRAFWILGMLACMGVGAFCLVVTLAWFHQGAAEQPFALRTVARRFFARLTGT